jgi:hypothetical protein
MSDSKQPSINQPSSIEKIGNWWSSATRGTKVVIAVLALALAGAIGALSGGGGGSIDTNSTAYNSGYYYGDGNLGSIDSPQSCSDRFNYVIGDGAGIYNTTDHLTSGDKDNFIAGCEKKQSGQ